MEKKKIIFDMDGVLIDSMGHWYKAYGETVKKFVPEHLVEEFTYVSMSKDKAALAKHMKDNDLVIDDSEFHQFWWNYMLDRLDIIPLKNGVKETLEYLHDNNYEMCIVTGAPKHFAEAITKKHNIGKYFKFILSEKDFGSTKKEKDIFLHTMEKLGSTLENTVLVEDTLHSIKTASEIGLITIAVADKTNEKVVSKILEYTKHYLNDVNDIVNIINKEE